MPEFSPFRGFLYDREHVPRLEDVTSPPYDVISESERRTLLERHPWNSAHLDAGDPDDLGDRYNAARRRFESWTARGILVRDTEPRLYMYRLRYRGEDGVTCQTSGVIGAVGLEAPGKGVLPHERTLANPLGDRLQLMRACPVNLSPIWLLSPATGLSELLEPEGLARAAMTDADDVHHSLYDISDAKRIATIAEAIASAPLVIADGHHRYQTALAYREEVGTGVSGASRVMAFVVELAREQLQVHPIHRLLHRKLGRIPEGAAVDGDLIATAREKRSLLIATGPSAGIVLDLPPHGRSAVAHLHESLLPRLGVDPAELSYEASPARIDDALRAGATAFLLPPLDVDEIASMARAGGRFPEKTTFFAPKPRTGLVFRSLLES